MLAAVVGLGAVASSSFSSWAAPAARQVNVRGPGEPDCPGEINRARARNDVTGVFLAEVMCRLHTKWKCEAVCKGDELLVTHVATRVQRSGQAGDTQVVQKSDSKAFDDMCTGALKTAGPFPAPPAGIGDASGAAPLKVEFACDCLELKKTPPAPAK